MNSNFLVDSQGYGGEGNYLASDPQEFNVKPFARAEVQEKPDKNGGHFITACFFLKQPDANGKTQRFAKISTTQKFSVGEEIPLDKVRAVELTDKRTGEVLKDPRIIW